MIKFLIQFCLNFFKSRTQLQLEIIFLRKQLEILNRSSKKLQIKNRDRLFFTAMKSIFSNWQQSLVIIKPATVINWHREGFKLYWKWKSRRKGRPRIETEIIQLIKQIANENPQWGVPRIHGEILKFGVEISESTVQRYVPKKNRRKSSQRWKTFLGNHASGIISNDFLKVSTINNRILQVLVFLSHERRRIIHFNVN